MIWLSSLLSALLFLLFAGQAFLVLVYAWRLRHCAPKAEAETACPTAAVVLCVRGNDPSLEFAVSAVLQQDYPDYSVFFVFDHESDPGFPVVERLMQASRRCDAQVLILPSVSGDSSLKCDAVVHAMKSLGDQFEVVALIDADTLVHRTWLREIVAPFRDPKVGATTGLRWYEPPGAELGALVRAIWNTAAIVQMYWYQIAWGGSLAVRREVLHRTELITRWSRAFCEDTLVSGELQKHGYRVEIVPSLHMVNYERCNLRGFYHWVTRQLLTTRLYHQAWPLVASHGLGTSLAMLAGLIFIPIAAWSNEATAMLMMIAALTVYELGSLGLLFLIRRTASKILGRSDRPLQQWGSETVTLFAVALPVTQLLYAMATLRSLFTRRVSWRGLDYDIGRSGQIRLKAYAPYSDQQDSLQPDHSL